MKMYYYIYHRFYTVTCLVGWAQKPQLAATVQISLLDWFATLTLLFLLAPRWAHQIFMVESAFNMIAVYAIMFLSNSLLFLLGKRYETILRRFQEESHLTKVIGSILTLLLFMGLLSAAVIVTSVAGH